VTPDPIVSLTNVSLWRRTQEELHYDLKRFIFSVLQGKRRKPHRRMVLDSIRLTVDPGEKIGIVGANGSGKSTLLKVICGILAPTTGDVTVNGSIAPLIELGAGFDPELSLVDNIIYYGMLLGVERRRMRDHLDPILDFAELQEYRTEPVKTLSSGMTGRLGFAIATEFRPDILILDEVLAVGDESFKRKCRERIDALWDEHSTIVVVSHDLDFITKNCDRGIWLEKGAIMCDGPPYEAVLRYKLAVEAHRLAGVSPEFPLVLLCPAGSDSKYADRVYAYIDGEKHWVNDERWIAEHGLDSNDALAFEDDVLDRIPEGHPMTYLDSAASR
jgi:ABC-type polysaccharide/polyol phosphate transport system ATPase subunit